MSQAAAASHGLAPQKVNLVRFGMITFLASEAMLFAGLIGSYIVLWRSQGINYRHGLEHWPVPLTGINTVILLSSSVTLWFGEKAVAQGRSAVKWLFLTTVLGAIFVSVQGYEWTHLYHENRWWGTEGTYSSSFFTLTGFHGLHVTIGVLMLFVSLLMAMAGRFTPHNHSFMECAALYWHFVDVVWIFLFSIMYVLPLFVG